MGPLDELVVALGFDYRGEGEARRFQQDLDRAARSTQGFMDKIGRFAAVAGAALGGLAIGNKLGGFISDITRVGAEFENYTNTLETLEGSQEAAKRSFDWIGRFADENSKAVGEATEAYIKMKAYGLDPADGSMKSIGDTASAMGKTMMEGVEALADAATGEFERLKEFGVRASVEGDRVTFLWSENGKQITKTVNKNATEIIGFMTEYGKRFDGQMEKQGKSWDGLTLRMANHWTRFLKAISDAGYYDDAKRRLGEVADKVQEWWDSGLIGNVAQGISDGLIGAMNTASHIATQMWRIGSAAYYTGDAIVSLTSKITGLSKAWSAAGLGVGLMATRAGGRAMLLALARRIPQLAAALLIDDVISGLNGDRSIIGGLKGGQDALDAVKRNFEDMQVAAEGLAETLNGVFGFDKMEGQTQLDALMAGIKDFAKGEYVKAVNDLALAIQAVADNLRAISDALQNPEAAFERFADAAIAQMDRVLAFIDGRLGGALTLLRLRAADEGEIVGPDGTVFKNGGTGEKQSRKPVSFGESQIGRAIFGYPEDEATSNVSDAFDLTSGTGQPSARPSNMLELEGSIFSTIRMLPTIISTAIARANGNTSQSNVDAFQRFIQGMQRTQEMISGQSLNMPMSAVDNRNQSVNVGAPQVTVNVTQPTAAPAAVGAAVGRAIGQAVQTRPQVAQAAAQ